MATLPAEAGGADAAATRRSNDLLDGLVNLNLVRQLGLMIGLAASVAIGFAVVLWSQGEEYQPLYANMDRMDPTDVLNVLQSNQITFKVDEQSGALLVAADQLHNARLKLAAAGIPSDGSFGFEILDKEQPLGTSQFMESARFKRSLEGELARTISSIRSVRSARVHLAIPKTSAFVRDARKPSASVFVDLYSGLGINPEQVRAIANLVASSIPELALEDVTVVDQRGTLLSHFEDDQDMALANRHLEYVQQFEKRLVKRIGSILLPLLGDEQFRAEVSADIDFTQVEQTDEQFNPDLPAIRSEQTMEESRVGGGPGGVPGALTNQPPGAGQAPEQAGADAGGAAGASGGSRVQATRNFELDRTISYTRHQVGRLRRLTVAVVINDVVQTDAETGEQTSTPWDQNELDRMLILIKDSVGFDAARGDSVNIINSPFILKPPAEEVEIVELPIWEQPSIQRYARWIGALVVLIVLIFGLLRPTMRSLTDSAKEVRELEAQRELGELSGDLGGDLSDEAVTLSGGDSLMLGGPNDNYEQQVNTIKGLVAEDPGRVAQVVKQWVAAGE